jgi:peptidoglycan/LPS O-acetylase OafA/YrhL
MRDYHIPELDGLRGLAALMVLAWHYTGSLFTPEFGSWVPWANKLLIFGRTGVDLFFVLSGFLIIGILVDNRQSPRYFRTFYVRRAARILPAYLLLVMMCWAGLAITGPNANFNRGFPLWAQLGFLTNWPMGWTGSPITRTFSVTWSVAIEEQFYLVFPLLVWLTPPTRLAAMLASIGALSIAARAGMYALVPSLPEAPYLWTPFRLDGLCAGGLIALAWRAGLLQGAPILIERWLIATAVIGIPILLWGLATSFYATMYLWGHTHLTALYGLLLAAVLARCPRAGVACLRWPSLRYVGRISYGLYLYHPLVLAVVFMGAGRRERITVAWEFTLMLAALAGTLILCAASFHAVEQPVRRRGHRYRY